MGQDTFDDWTDVYEAMLDWSKRLANEEPFYRELFDRCRARRVLDAACGTGRHAAMFHAWGLEVEGADVSPAMIARARSFAGQPAGLGWVVRGFGEPVETPANFDVAVCVGNSLALAPDLAAVEQALRTLLAAVRDGGFVVVQILNLWRLPNGPCVWQKCKRAVLGQDESLIVKGVHRCGSQGFVELVVTRLAGEAKMRHESVSFLGLEAGELATMARQAGAKNVAMFGDYQRQLYSRDTSTDLLMVAEK